MLSITSSVAISTLSLSEMNFSDNSMSSGCLTTGSVGGAAASGSSGTIDVSSFARFAATDAAAASCETHNVIHCIFVKNLFKTSSKHCGYLLTFLHFPDVLGFWIDLHNFLLFGAQLSQLTCNCRCKLNAGRMLQQSK